MAHRSDTLRSTDPFRLEFIYFTTIRQAVMMGSNVSKWDLKFKWHTPSDTSYINSHPYRLFIFIINNTSNMNSTSGFELPTIVVVAVVIVAVLTVVVAVVNSNSR